MKSSINFKTSLTILLFSVIAYSFFLSLNFVFADYRDEIGYLSDSILLAEGLRPSYSHAPSGLSTWFGTIIIFFQYIFVCLKKYLDFRFNFFI